MFWAYEAGGEFVYRYGGRDYKIPAAVDVHHDALAQVVGDLGAFASLAQVPPDMPGWALLRLREVYLAYQGVPDDIAQVQALFQAMEHFGEEIELDLLPLDVVSLFRERRWRRLMNAISRIPRASYYWQSAMNDPETAKAIEEQRAKKGSKAKGFPVSEYTTTVQVLADQNNLIKNLTTAVIAAGGGKPKTPETYPGMISLLDRMKTEVRKSEHEKLSARVLPSRGQVQ